MVHNERQRGNEINPYDLARSFQETAVDQIVRKSELALKKYDVKNMIVAGGVSANKFLRSEVEKMCLENGVHLSIPPIRYCTDNAAMIACAAYPLYKRGEFQKDYSLNANSHENFFDKKD